MKTSAKVSARILAFRLEKARGSCAISGRQRFRSLAKRAGLLAICITVSAPRRSAAQDIGLVSRMATKEAEARRQKEHFAFTSEEISKRTGGHRWRERVVETDDGPLRALLAVDGVPLTPSQSKTDRDRVFALVKDPAAFRAANLSHMADEARATELLSLLPKQFILTPSGKEGGCELFRFRPDPSFQPRTIEERVAHGMSGTVSIRGDLARLCSLRAGNTEKVDFGFGVLGRLEPGGQFVLERTMIDPEHWKSKHIAVHLRGRVLLLKSLISDREVVRDEIVVVPQHLTLTQAATRVLQQNESGTRQP